MVPFMAHHHSHDNIDWDAHLTRLREADDLAQPETRQLVDMVLRPEDRSVTEVGSGAGGAAAAFASALPESGSRITLIDTAAELLSAASERVRQQAPGVEVRTLHADAATSDVTEAGEADLVFASCAVHHLPDQLDGLRRLAGLARSGGRVAIVETGLSRRVLPWDIGLGEPGLEERLLAARNLSFAEMRQGMEGSVRLPMGWSAALEQAGLTDVRSWSLLFERPAPVSGAALRAVERRLEWLYDAAVEHCGPADVQALEQLLDSDGENYIGHRKDTFILGVDSVFVGTRR